MSVLIFELTQAQATALLMIAAKNDVRYYLNGICIDTEGKAPVAVATDGHRALAIRLPPSTGGDLPRGCYIIPRKALASVKADKIGTGTLPITVTIISEEGAKPRATISGATTAVADLIDGRYPEWRRIVPATASGVVAQFNGDYLADFQAIAELLSDAPKGGRFSRIAHNGDGGALICLGSEDAVGVCMPMRADAPPARPDWV